MCNCVPSLLDPKKTNQEVLAVRNGFLSFTKAVYQKRLGSTGSRYDLKFELRTKVGVTSTFFARTNIILARVTDRDSFYLELPVNGSESGHSG